MKYANILLFIFLTTIYLTFSSHIKFSTNFIEIFFSQESLKLFDIAKKLGFSNEIYISKKGFNSSSKIELKKIADELIHVNGIEKVETSFALSDSMRKYLKKNYFLLADFNNTKLTEEKISQKLKKLHYKIYNSVLYEPINKYDPLNLFNIKFKNNQEKIKLKNFGFIIKAKTSIDTSNASRARALYNDINKILKKHSDTIAYAPFFYLVENSAYIRSDAQKIMGISMIFLLILYFIILKNHKLFINAILAISSSILSAILLTSFIFGSVSILALVFGISVTSISIDYMFHYYFHNNFSQKKFIFQKRVFFGFFTTIGVFIIFSFINIELFAQLAIFSIVSLCMAYLIFSLFFVYLDIKVVKIEQNSISLKSFNSLHVLIVSCILLAFSYHNLTFDKNLKNLDYKNIKLEQIAKKFNDSLKQDKYKSVIISAKTKELLLEKYERVLTIYPNMLGIGKFVYSDKKCKEKLQVLQNYDFVNVKKSINFYSKKIGFNDIFANSYSKFDKLKCDMKVLENMKFKIAKNDNMYYTMALIKKDKLTNITKDIKVIDLAKSLSKDTQVMKSILVKYMIISIVFIIITLLVSLGWNIFYPLSYLLFPISTVLFCISLFGKINIMHIFALVILVAISIDYGIYMHKTSTMAETKIAIKYSLLSTFSGFGVLIFSNTAALHSIGFVITIGIASIFFLLYGRMPFLKG